MVEVKNDGGPAFPQSTFTSAYPDNGGMSLRDLFAGHALMGLCANPDGPFQCNDLNGWGLCNCTEVDVSAQAYRMADAMIAARALSKASPNLLSASQEGETNG